MGERLLKFCLRTALIAALLMPGGLWAAEWEKLTWDGAPKDKEGKPEGINTVAVVGKNNVLFVYGDRIVRWDGKSFKEEKHDYSGKGKHDIRNLVVVSENDIWGVGDNGIIVHYNGEKWDVVKNPVLDIGRREGRLWGAGCAKPDLCFAGTRPGALIQWDGKEWKLVSKAGDPPAEGARIYAIDFISENNGWMVGEALVAKWDGKGWTKTDIEVPRIYDMVLVNKDFGWMVGDGGAFFKFDGKTWTKIDVKGSFFRMRGVDCASKNDCWAGGDAGAAFHWDGKEWTKVKLGTFDRLNRVKFGHGHGFMVTDKGGILKHK